MIKRYPEDRFGNTFIGIKLPMNGDRTTLENSVFNMSTTTEEQAVSNYINLLLTKKGERYMQPTFGIGLQYRLFEPNTLALRTEIEFDIYNQSAIWLPYIHNHEIIISDSVPSNSISSRDRENSIQIIIRFSVTERGANKSITLFQNQGRIQYIIE